MLITSVYISSHDTYIRFNRKLWKHIHLNYDDSDTKLQDGFETVFFLNISLTRAYHLMKKVDSASAAIIT